MQRLRADKRAFVVVLDACGVGALPDAAEYGDAGANTLGHLADVVGGLKLPTLGKLGLGSIIPLTGVPSAAEPVLHGRLAAIGPGKDSTAGHWGLMGVGAAQRPPTYPHGFPPEVIDLISAESGRAVICNSTRNGIEAVEQFGSEHLRTGALIVYTSQDSVLQIAAHVDAVPAQELYDICAGVRRGLGNGNAVGRVIARPFEGVEGRFRRSDGRKDFALQPPVPSHLLELQQAGFEVHGVGKVAQLFAGVGFDVEHEGHDNARALAATTELIATLDRGLVFTNLVDTDQVYGHRHDAEGFHRALQEIDQTVEQWLGMLRAGDLLVLCADHGCDVTAPHTDHTREYAPLLAVFAGHGSRRRDGSLADVGAGVLAWLAGADAPQIPGHSFI